jgi:hypothetical protein
MAGFVEEILPYEGLHESLGRSIIDAEDFLSQYQAGNKDFMREIVFDAKKVLSL